MSQIRESLFTCILFIKDCFITFKILFVKKSSNWRKTYPAFKNANKLSRFFRFLKHQIKILEMHFATVSLRFPAESIEIDWLARVSRSRSFKWCYFPCHCELQFEQKKKSWGRGRCMQFLLTNWLIFRLCLSSQVPPLTWINISWNWNKNSHEHFKTTHVEQSKVSKALAFPFVCQRKALFL